MSPPREPQRPTPPKEPQHPHLGAKEIADLEKELELDLENLDVNDDVVSILNPLQILRPYNESDFAQTTLSPKAPK